MRTEALIRSYFDTWRTGNRAVMEAALTEDFTFTSLRDDHIDRQAFFDRCWPMAGSFESFDIHRILIDGDQAIVMYDARNKTGERFHNTEILRMSGPRIRSVEVFLGRPQSPRPAITRSTRPLAVLSLRR